MAPYMGEQMRLCSACWKGLAAQTTSHSSWRASRTRRKRCSALATGKQPPACNYAKLLGRMLLLRGTLLVSGMTLLSGGGQVLVQRRQFKAWNAAQMHPSG